MTQYQISAQIDGTDYTRTIEQYEPHEAVIDFAEALIDEQEIEDPVDFTVIVKTDEGMRYQGEVEVAAHEECGPVLIAGVECWRTHNGL